MNFDAITVATTGTTVTSSGTSAAIIVPNAADGTRARYCRLQSTGFVYVKLGLSGVAATSNDLLVSPNEGIILASRQFTHLAYLQESVGAKLNIVPVEA